jgi:AcrR family transcriptional regulator
MPRTAKKKAGTYHHGDLRRSLLDAAIRVVEKEGIAALSLHALSRKAGVSSGAPYHHFESREQLLAAIAREGFSLLTVELRRSAEEAEANRVDERESLAEARLRGIGRGYVRFALAHSGHFRMMFRPELKSQLLRDEADAVGEPFELLKNAITRCQAEGTIPAGDPRALMLLAWSTVHGAAALWVDGTLAEEGLVPDAETLGPSVADTLVGLLRSAAEARRSKPI